MNLKDMPKKHLPNPDKYDFRDVNYVNDLQAYGKRSFDVINWLNDHLKKRAGMHLRLVKGAATMFDFDSSPITALSSHKRNNTIS